MENSGDKFSSVIIPDCHPTVSQEDKLQCCPFARESSVIIQLFSSPDDSPEQATGIEIVSLPYSFDEYDVAAKGSDNPDKAFAFNDAAHQVFDEMPQRQKQNIECSKGEEFTSLVDRVLKMVDEGKRKHRGGDDVEVDFLETAKIWGLTFPRPRWWPAEGFKDYTP